MPRPFFSATQKPKSNKNRFNTSMSARAIALFFCLVFVLSLSIQSASMVSALSLGEPKNPKALDVANQIEAPIDGATGKSDEAVNKLPEPGQKQVKHAKRELIDKRTASTKTFDNGDGTGEVQTYMGRVHYKVDGKWQDIDTSLIEDTNAADSSNFVGETFAWLKGKTQDLNTYKVKGNDWQARFAASDDPVGMVRIQADGQNTAFAPKNANSVEPLVQTQGGQQVVVYKNLWNGVDVQYTVKNDQLKEDIVLHSSDAENVFGFAVAGAKLKRNAEGGLGIEGSKQFLAPLSLSVGKSGVVTGDYLKQDLTSDGVTITINKTYLSSLKGDDFPVAIDPTWSRGTATVGWNYEAYKSDGYRCPASSCFMNAGYVYDNGWKGWRSFFRIDFNVLQGKQLLDASMHLHKSQRSWWTGTTEGLYTELSHASCNAYNCIDYGAPRHSAWFGTDGDINFTALMQSRMNIGDWGAWFMLNGEERAYTTMKGWDADNSYFVLSYNNGPGMTTPASPADQQVVVTDQPILQVNPVGDADGDTPNYYFRIATGSNAESGTIINSGWMSNQTTYTIPEGQLQDGVTYYWHAYTNDNYWQTNPDWVRSFKYDARLGNDTAASFDDGGPVDVNLATGNVTTSAGTHTTTALGGSIGLSLEYNSPYRSKPGLEAQYFNNTSFSGYPANQRIETNLNFPWNYASPAPGSVNPDGFSTRLTGYFVAPKTATYQFGFSADDSYALYLNNEPDAAVSAGCCAQSNWNMAPRTFTEGQIVPIRIDHVEGGGPGYMYTTVKIDGVEQQIQSQWLRTAPRPTYDNAGLMGKYYYDSGNHVFPDNEFESFLQRREKVPNFNWDVGSPVVNGPTDNFMARYTGYFTAPATGTYQFGAGGDDGTRIFLNGSTTPYRSDWVDRGFTLNYGGDVFLTAGQSIPITAEYYENTGGASFGLYVRGSAVPEQIIPSTWLSTKINSLPNGWQQSVDADGDLSYEYAVVQAQSVVLYDADGDQHEYKWTGSAYTPPVNDYGTLTRNADGTLTLLDSDGRTYVFDSAGRLTSATSPTDDRKPAALKYTYGTAPGNGAYIPRLLKITDGVDPNRWGAAYYAGDTECGSVPSGYDAVPSNMLCAFKTNDGRTTQFVYKNGMLARIVANGEETTSLGYDAMGRVVQHQSSLAYDVVKNGVRADDAAVTTQLTYDQLGRASQLTFPAAVANGFRAQHNYTYFPTATQTNEVSETEPKGYSQRIEYDALYRTTKSFDKSGNVTTQEWNAIKDLLLSTTDATGLKSTTIYNANDLPTDSYGPAPAEWFDSNPASSTYNRPLAAYDLQVPHTSSGYDEGINGPAVAYFNYKANGKILTGAPKLHATGINANTSLFLASWGSASPITPDAGMDGWGLTATGKLTPTATGQHMFRIWHDDGVRLYIDDKVVIDDWNAGAFRNNDAYLQMEAGKSYRFKLDYFDADKANAYLELYMKANGGVVTGDNQFGDMLKPDYGLQTSQTAYGSPTSGGATSNTKSTTSYGSNPELGLAQSSTTDAGGLNLTATATYEARDAAGSYLRQTSSSLPGATLASAATGYTYYGATETRVNPCDASKTYRQGGMLKLKTEPDPDGAGVLTGRVTETVYDDAGKIAATRYNQDSWTCTTYDARERVVSTSIPAFNGQPARTVTNNYAVVSAQYTLGNPLVTTSSDSTGNITIETDLLGRNVNYTDAKGNVTTSEYDNAGHITKRTSQLGVETFVYDDFDRLVDQLLDGTVYAHVTYDQFSRIDNVTYPAASTQKVTYARDTLGRLNSLTYVGNTPGTPATPNTFNNVRALSNNYATENVITAAGGNYTDTPHSQNAFTVTGLTAAYDSTKSTQFSLAVDSGTKSGNTVQTRVSYDFTGDGTWDRLETYNTFATNNRSGYEAYTQAAGLKSVTGTPANLQNGKVKVEVWSATGTAQSTINTPTSTTATNASTLTLPYTNATPAIPGSSNVTIAADQVTRAVTGDVVSGTELGQSKAYSYDTAGRLVDATIGSNSFTYGFGTQDSTCGVASNQNANSGMDSNRTTQTVNGVATKFCYDYADRLVSSSDTKYTGTIYDTHGNTTSMGTGTNLTTFQYDSSDRNIKITQGTKSTTYSRDVQGRIVSRSVVNGTTTVSNYGFTASGDTPDFVKDASGNVTEKYLTLPGDVLVTIRPGATGNAQKTYSLPNIHGDVFATTDANGTLLGTTLTGPFGEAVLGQTAPNNTANGGSFGYVSKHEKLTETNFTLTPIQMGARVYVPGLGRFLSVDTVQGGTPNNYVYATDAVNEYDLTGRFIPLVIAAIYVAGIAWSAYDLHKNPSPTNMAFMALSVVPGGGGAKLGAKGIQAGTRVATGLKLGEHAAKQMSARNVSIKNLNHVIKTGQRGTYYEKGVKKLGIYSPKSQIFVATRGKKIITVITKVTKQYVNGLKRRR